MKLCTVVLFGKSFDKERKSFLSLGYIKNIIITQKAARNIVKPVFIVGIFAEIFINVLLYFFQFGVYLKCKFSSIFAKFQKI